MFTWNKSRLFLVAWALLLPSCGSSHLGSIKATSVDIVDGGYQVELAGRPRDFRYGNLVLRLEFSSPINYFKLSHKYEYNMGIEIRWCGDGDNGRRIEDGLSYFYMEKTEVQGGIDPKIRPHPLLTTSDGKAFLYHAYFHVKQVNEVEEPEPTKKLPPYPRYDLNVHPRDLCLWVRGGNMLGFHGISSKAVFSSRMIEDALRRHQHP